MNRELEKLLKEKWFLVAADLIAVMNHGAYGDRYRCRQREM